MRGDIYSRAQLESLANTGGLAAGLVSRKARLISKAALRARNEKRALERMKQVEREQRDAYMKSPQKHKDDRTGGKVWGGYAAAGAAGGAYKGRKRKPQEWPGMVAP